MKIKYIFLLVFFIFVFDNAFSKDYDNNIKDLQKQIDELNKKISEQSKSSNKNNFLEGFKINGRIHVDGSWFDKSSELEKYNSNTYNDNVSIRRARLSISKEINKFVFNFEGNFDKDKAYLGETYIGYNFNNDAMIRIGQVTNPSFMEREKSSNTMATIDYNSFIKMGWVPWYIIGVNYYIYTDKFGFSTGVFGNGTNIESKLENDTTYNFSSRIFYTPIRNENSVIHLGADFSYQRYREDTAANPTNIDSGYYFGLELGLQYKNFTWNSEYIKSFYDYEKNYLNGNKFNFDGIATEFIFTLTGEHRLYNKAGYFGGLNVKNPISKGGLGAFEAVFRYSRAYGEDSKNGFSDNIGSTYDYTFGLNWFPENYFIVLLNYSINNVKNSPIKNSGSKGKYNLFKIEARMFF